MLRVDDDGQGFEPSRVSSTNGSGHYGLTSMRERAEQVGGSLRVDSAPGRGHPHRSDGAHRTGRRKRRMTTESPIRVLCVDDHRIVREGIALIINRQPDMEVVGRGRIGRRGGRTVSHLPSRRDVDGPAAAAPWAASMRSARSAVRTAMRAIVVLTMYSGDEDIYRRLAGRRRHLPAEGHAVRRSDSRRSRGPQWQDAARPRCRGTARRAGRHGRTLTPREVQVVELIAQGMRNKEIAAALGISEETAQVHVKNILAKLKVKDRTAAVSVALRRGIIHM